MFTIDKRKKSRLRCFYLSYKLLFFMHFRPGTMRTHAESINSDLQRQTFTTHTTLNTEQNQLAIKVSD